MSPTTRRASTLAAYALSALLLFACVTRPADQVRVHGWWSGLGPVVPHDSFPADCRTCHEGTGWNDLVEGYTFDHEAETGVALTGAHDLAQCLRCHNDRGPVEVYAAKGCAGCHEDIHQGMLGSQCTTCHTEDTWNPSGQVEFHQSTRFPLTGIHAVTACRRCHEGFEVGRFTHTDTQCVTCHRDDLARAQNPDHQSFGFVNRCDRCHIPTSWNEAETTP